MSNDTSKELKDLAKRNVHDVLNAVYGMSEVFNFLYPTDTLDLEESDVNDIVGTVVTNVLDVGKYQELLDPEDEGLLVLYHEILDGIEASSACYKFALSNEVEVDLVDQVRYVLESFIDRAEYEVEERIKQKA